MITFILGFAIGLVVGWNFLPQPEFVKNLLKKKDNNNPPAA